MRRQATVWRTEEKIQPNVYHGDERLRKQFYDGFSDQRQFKCSAVIRYPARYRIDYDVDCALNSYSILDTTHRQVSFIVTYLINKKLPFIPVYKCVITS